MARGVTADQFTGCSQRFISMDRNLEGRDWETAGKAIWRRDVEMGQKQENNCVSCERSSMGDPAEQDFNNLG